MSAARHIAARRQTARCGAATVLACAAYAACAQGQAPAAPAASSNGAASSNAQPGDAALGARIASQGVPNVAACAGCHGANGEGNAAAGFPRIAGQSPAYLVHQLQAYASGARQNPVMAPIAKAMNEEQQRAAAAHYAALDPGSAAPAANANKAAPANATASTSPANATASKNRGQVLASVGDNTLRVQACANCHGAGGAGQAPAYPYLAGQVAGYLQSALAEWKSGARKTDPSGQMPTIAQHLGDADVRALVAYYAGLAPPPARERDAATAWRPARAITVVSGPKSAAAGGAQGVGSEQGAATTGGSQGPGGAGGGSGAGAQGSRSGAPPPSR